MKRAIVLIDHGSRREEANQALEEVAAMLRRILAPSVEGTTGDPVVVRAAHMELASPSLRDAIVACFEEGARELVVVPYFLSPGRHVSEDIPALAAEAARDLAGLTVRVSAPLGPDEALARLALSRFEQIVGTRDPDPSP